MQADEAKELVAPTRSLTVRRCEVRLGQVRKTGEREVLPLAEAMTRLAPSRSRRARMNVVNARVGWYIGLRDDKGCPPPILSSRTQRKMATSDGWSNKSPSSRLLSLNFTTWKM